MSSTQEIPAARARAYRAIAFTTLIATAAALLGLCLSEAFIPGFAFWDWYSRALMVITGAVLLAGGVARLAYKG